MAEALLGVQYARSPPTAASEARLLALPTRTASSMGAAKPAVVVQSCRNWKRPPLLADVQPFACTQPLALNRQHGAPPTQAA